MTKPLVFLAVALFLFVGVASAHPNHVSVAEVERNTETGRLEVALRCWPEDIEKVLSDRAGEDVTLESAPDIDERITHYLNEVFLIAPSGDAPPDDWRPDPIIEKNKRGEPVEIPRIIWVGKELERRDLWLYFEVRLPERIESLEGAWISNRLFLATVPSQENVMTIRDDDWRVTVRTEKERPWATITPRAEGTP